ncbi:MAG: glutamate--tRNA ligase [Candidatus Marsarchaeota archaeon]|nr:glutamate--tRNA ligase [Candidatus Marsarchaeota archaeon]
MASTSVDEGIRRIAVRNASEYGKARVSAVLGKSLARFPELKSDMKALSVRVSRIVAEVNAMDDAQLRKELGRYSEEFRSEDRERAEKSSRHNLELRGAVAGRFMTRFPPEPNGYMQLGHAKAAWTEREAADMYKGTVALYFDDTNPEKERQEFVDAIRKDMKWLGIGYDTEYFASDNMALLYGYAVKLIERANAYVCLCPRDEIKDQRMRGASCRHKRQGVKRNMELWREMLASESDAAMILRFNGDMKSDNTAMRDPTLFRIKTERHYRQGSEYRVWPTYVFNTPIIDSVKGVTDVIRSKEFEMLDELYLRILQLLRLRKPRIHSIARLEIKDNLTSKRRINELIDKGLLWGYDDPRLVTIAGLRRRGVLPAAIKAFAMRFGMSKSESRVGIDMLLAENRKLVDSDAKRLFIVENPVRLSVRGIPEAAREVKLRLHPGTDMGFRRYRLSSEFFINAYDTNKLAKGDQIRLKDAFSIRICALEGNTISAEYVASDSGDIARIQWVNEGNYMPCKAYRIGNLLVGDEFNKQSMTVSDAYVESHAESLAVGEIVQFERVGFFKLDNKSGMDFLSL